MSHTVFYSYIKIVIERHPLYECFFHGLGEYINEDGELALAYETQKTINKQLELELQDEKSKFKAHEREYKLEIEKLREDNDRQQRLLAANLTSSPQSQTEAFMQHEITRLTAENLDLQVFYSMYFFLLFWDYC